MYLSLSWKRVFYEKRIETARIEHKGKERGIICLQMCRKLYIYTIIKLSKQKYEKAIISIHNFYVTVTCVGLSFVNQKSGGENENKASHRKSNNDRNLSTF